MKAKLKVFFFALLCCTLFLHSCGKKNNTAHLSNSVAKPDSANITSISTTTQPAEKTGSTDSIAPQKDVSITLPEQKNTPTSVIPSQTSGGKKQTAGAKVTEKNQNKHNSGSDKPLNEHRAGQNSGTNTVNTVTNANQNTTTPATNPVNTTTQQEVVAAPEIRRPKDPIPPTPAENIDFFFKEADNFFKRNVLPGSGLVNYSGIKADKTELNSLIFKIGNAFLDELTDAQKEAFYINAYNILVIKQVVDNNMPVSPLDVPGFFNQTKFKVALKNRTLDQLEKNVLFGLKNDPRFHFVLVCAAKGCPPLLNAAYLPKTLNQQLTQQTKAALNNSNFVKTNTAAKKASVSKIFEWYNTDFTAGGKSVVQFINQYRNAPIPENYTLDYYEYDWSLNRQ